MALRACLRWRASQRPTPGPSGEIFACRSVRFRVGCTYLSTRMTNGCGEPGSVPKTRPRMRLHVFSIKGRPFSIISRGPQRQRHERVFWTVIAEIRRASGCLLRAPSSTMLVPLVVASALTFVPPSTIHLPRPSYNDTSSAAAASSAPGSVTVFCQGWASRQRKTNLRMGSSSLRHRQARQHFRAEALRHHPDRGGSVEAFMDAAATWSEQRKHFGEEQLHQDLSVIAMAAAGALLIATHAEATPLVVLLGLSMVDATPSSEESHRDCIAPAATDERSAYASFLDAFHAIRDAVHDSLAIM